jgi:8-hydroxy-5-deazaflavin:NADPH oxidoreductase
VDAGPLANSVVAESLTSALIWINRTYKIPDAGIRITGLPESVARGEDDPPVFLHGV